MFVQGFRRRVWKKLLHPVSDIPTVTRRKETRIRENRACDFRHGFQQEGGIGVWSVFPAHPAVSALTLIVALHSRCKGVAGTAAQIKPNLASLVGC